MRWANWTIVAFVIFVAPANAAPSRGKPTTAPAATQPTTRSSTGQRLAIEVEAARKAFAAQQQACIDRLAADAAYRAAVADEASKARALQQARAGTDSSKKVAAGAAWTKSRERVSKLRDDALAADQGVRSSGAALVKALADLEASDEVEAERAAAAESATRHLKELLVGGPCGDDSKLQEQGAVLRVDLKISQIVDGRNALAEAWFYAGTPLRRDAAGKAVTWRGQTSSHQVWLADFPTKGYIDGSRFVLTVKVAGTKQYERAIGGTATVPLTTPFMLEKQDIRLLDDRGRPIDVVPPAAK